MKRYNLAVFGQHARDWRDNHYVYPVISRRSAGLSVGINLNPDTACNFDCVYCQVDRSQPVTVRKVELRRLGEELDRMLGWAVDRSLFSHPRFADVPDELRRINDIAFSGDGEPTACPVFLESVRLAARFKSAHGLTETKIVLITNACYLTRSEVAAGLAVMDANNGEIWAKLDAGTQAYFQRINRPSFSLAHVMENIAAAATKRPICIQSLFAEIDGHPPGEEEIAAYVERLREVKGAGGRIKLVQVCTLARKPAEAYVAPLSNEAVDAIADTVARLTGLETARYYSA